jgi:SAM-dependent methyltransferase
MDRDEWIKQRRRLAEERYDRMWAPIYDENWGSYLGPLHLSMLSRVLQSLPAEGLILDAACGTGKYWPMLVASGRDFVGIDQSAAMLERARSKFSHVPVHKVGLQEMRFKSAFDLIICMDAMENVFPEDWPQVLMNFCRALKPAGQLYFTVELTDPSSLEADYRSALAKGLPVLPGESIGPTGPGDEEGGYHFYPSIEQVRQWLTVASFSILEEAEADDYHHFLCRSLAVADAVSTSRLTNQT